MEPQLTDKVIRGLARMAARAEADMPEDVLGDDPTGRSERESEEQDELESAIDWIRRVRHARRPPRGASAPRAAGQQP